MTPFKENPMIARLIAGLALCGTFVPAAVAQVGSLAGHWTFDTKQSRNVGMMAGMAIHTTISQTSTEVIVDDVSDFNGEKDTQHTVYNLAGKPVTNTPIMGGTATTRSHWVGAKLITVWESAGSVAGTTAERTETRYLSPDGATMYVESGRPAHEAMVMVFARDR
jgi:hypothetical protein